MTKKEFMIAYVLGRAKGNTGGLDGKLAVLEAEKAWNEIQKLSGGETECRS